MIIQYDLTLDDLVAFDLYWFDHAPKSQSSRTFALMWVAAVLAIPVSFLIVFGFRELMELSLTAVVVFRELMELSLIAVVVSAVCLAVYVSLFPIVVTRHTLEGRARRRYSLRRKELIGFHELELTESKLITRSSVAESALRLEAIERVVTTDSHVFAFITPVSAIVIPRKTIDQRKCDEFVGALEERRAMVRRHDTRLMIRNAS
jgi:hypothetical protein